MQPDGRDIAILVKDLEGGGVQKMRIAIAQALSQKGYRVELVALRAKGVLANQVPASIPVRALERSRPLAWRRQALSGGARGVDLVLRTLWRTGQCAALAYLPGLVDYLRREQPDALLSATPYINVMALHARRIAGVPTRVLVSEHNDLTRGHLLGSGPELKRLKALLRIYGEAEMVVAVSQGVAHDVAARSGLPEEQIVTIYNPAVTPELDERAAEPLDDPWFAPDAPPVILAVGQLSERKDYPTLLRAMKRVREQRDVRLVILGKAGDDNKTAQEQQKLADLAADLGIADAVAMPGFTVNPYRYMARAGVLVLSSLHEGFGNVIPEALACGCPVVSTDCPSGPAEILDGGRFGALVPVGDAEAMARAILATLENPPPPDRLHQRAMQFTVANSAAGYETILLDPSIPAAAE